jgi:gluconolactonase
LVFGREPFPSKHEDAMPALLRSLIGGMLLVAPLSYVSRADDAPATIRIADGKMQLKAPGAWNRKQPQSPIIEHEFAIPAAKGDQADGRLTIMAASGGVQPNIDRWYGQFTQPDGGSTRERAKVTKSKIAGQEVHIVDLSGTYKDQRGPVAPAVERPNYRMLAAIVTGKSGPDYFFKLYGPERTIAENEKAFVTMIEGLEAK